MSGKEFEEVAPLLAAHDAVVPPLLPEHVQIHGPVPVTVAGIPTLQSKFVGMVGNVLTFAEPHTPFVTGGVPVICVGAFAASALLVSSLSTTAESTSALAPK